MVNSQPAFELAILGPFKLIGATGLIPLPNRKLAALLAFLACTHPVPQPRDKLVTLFWGSHFQKQARQNLRQALVRLRQILGADSMAAEGDTLTLSQGVVHCDAVRFLSLLRSADEASTAAAVQLYRGPFLDDVIVNEAGWTDWIRVERRKFEDQALDAMVAVGEFELAAARYQRARTLARQVLAINPFREDACRLLISALIQNGRTADALAYFGDFVGQLKEELGADPDPGTADLIASVREKSAMLDPYDRQEPRNFQSPSGLVSIVGRAANDDETSMAVVMRTGSYQSIEKVEAYLLSHEQVRAETAEVGGCRYWSLSVPSPMEAARLGLHLKQMPHRAESSREKESLVAIGADLASCRSKRPFAGPLALAEISGRGQFLATEDVCEKLVEGIDATVCDLGLIAMPHARASIRAFELLPVDLLAGGKKIQFRMRPLIAVLPFEEVPRDALPTIRGELFAEEIINILSASNHVDVVTRISTRHLAHRNCDLASIAINLRADYVIAGAISPDGNAFRISADLIEAQSGIVRKRCVRTASISQPHQFRDVSLKIISELGDAIMIQQAERALTQPLDSLDSYSLLFAGIAMMDRWTQSSFEKSGEILRHLKSRAPSHPLANAWLSAWHTRSISQGWTRNVAADATKALELVGQSLDVDPNCSTALTMDGWANVYVKKDLSFAAQQLTLATEVNSSDALAWLLKGVVHAFQGDGQKASGATEHSLQLSPLDPRRSYYLSMASTAEIAAGNFDKAIGYASTSLRLNRLHPSTLRALAIAQWESGLRQDARATVSKLMALCPDFTIRDYRRSHPSMQGEFGQKNARTLHMAGVPS